MALQNKRWECTDCDYTTEHPSLAENHRNGLNHKLSLLYEQSDTDE